MPHSEKDQDPLTLCILNPSNNAWSETFIKNHIDYLPFDTVILNGAELSQLSFEGKLLVQPTLFNRLRKKILGSTGARGGFLEQRKLIHFLRDKKIQVVLAEYGHVGTLIVGACARLQIPLVVHFHGNDASHRPTLEALKKEYSEMFAYATSIISVSRAMTQRLKAMGAPADKIVENCYGIDTALFHESDKKWPAPTFIAVGRFVEKKAPHLTLAAFSRAAEINPSIRLIMIGDGVLLETCKQLAKAYRIEESVEFAGIQTPAAVAEKLSRSLAFVQHSVVAADGSAEGTPLAILEAGACGLPVISTRHEGIPDVIIEKETGILVDEFDIGKMAEAMVSLAADPALATEMGKKARLRIDTNYALKRHIDALAATISNSFQKSAEHSK